MTDIILIVLLIGIAAGIVFYLCRAKKRGETCIGCPYAKQCADRQRKNGQGGCPCQGNTADDTDKKQ